MSPDIPDLSCGIYLYRPAYVRYFILIFMGAVRISDKNQGAVRFSDKFGLVKK